MIPVPSGAEPAGGRRGPAVRSVPAGGRCLQPGLLHRQQTPLGAFVFASPVVNCDTGFLIGLLLRLCSPMSYGPSRVTRWLTSHAASLTSTSFTSARRVALIRPSGKSIRAQGQNRRCQESHVPQSSLGFSPLLACLFIDSHSPFSVYRYCRVSSITPPSLLPFT